MPLEFRYSLTRICLRSGQLSLSQRMAEIFPESGKVRVLDTLSGGELEVEVVPPRRIAGVAEFLRRHRLEVNDSVLIRLSDEGTVSFTALPRRERRPRSSEAEIVALLDGLVADKPRTEEEIRALYPQIPADYPLARALAAHPRLRQLGGRWAATEDISGTQSERSSHFTGPTEVRERPSHASETPGRPEALHENRRVSGAVDGRVEERSLARQRRRESRNAEDRSAPTRVAAVTPYPKGVMFPGEAALNSKRPATDLKQVNRARELLSEFGYVVEGLPHGMLLARADLGRRQYAALVRVLSDAERLDWAALLASRREQNADYLAIVGDHRDLHRLSAPADLAKATLWSWDGLARVQNLAQSIPIGPFDLEPHFVAGGMFDEGLGQFERNVGRLVAEKGVFSAVLAGLAAREAPAVFVLDDLVEGELQRDQVARVLDLLMQAPFHLIARIDSGEYCLRHGVHESLEALSQYASSLRERLPRQDSGRVGVLGEENAGR